MRLLLLCFLFVCKLSVNAQIDSARFYEKNGDYYKALGFYTAWYNNATDTLSNNWFNNNLAMAKCYRLNGMLGEGLLAFEKGIRNAEFAANEYYELKYKIYLGDYFLWIDEITALSYFKLIPVNRLYKYPDLEIIFHHRKATLYNVLEEFFDNIAYVDSALHLATLSLSKAKQIGYQDAIATSFNEIANLNEKLLLYDIANLYYDSAAYIFNQEENLIDYVNVHINKSRLNVKMQNWPELIKSFNTAVAIAEKNDWHFYLFPLYHIKKNYYLQIGDSLNYYKYYVLEESNYVKNLKNRAQEDLLKLQTQFNLKEREQNLELKNQQYINEKAKKQGLALLTIFLVLFIAVGFYFYAIKKRDARKLRILLAENEFLLGESNHRIKNNLQLIISLLARETDNQDGIEISKLQEIASKIESISTLHQQLYKAADKKSVDLKNYLEDILENFQGLMLDNKVDKSVICDNQIISIEKAMYFGLLTAELVMNTLKYAFVGQTENPKIELRLIQKDTQVIYHYKDNGVGIPEGEKVQLALLLARQLKSEVKTYNDDGFNFFMSVPTYQNKLIMS
ncbi:MAG: sensor histidine kinase [Luteibaculaceae bacterium]